MEVTEGSAKGKQGIVTSVLRARNSVIVQGARIHPRFVSATQRSSGYMYEAEAPIHRSNVALLDPVSGRPTRVRIQRLESGEKARIAVRSGAVIPKPADAKQHCTGNRTMNARSDTPPAAATERTYIEPDFAALREWLDAKRALAEKVAAEKVAELRAEREASRRVQFRTVKGRRVPHPLPTVAPKLLFRRREVAPRGFEYHKQH